MFDYLDHIVSRLTLDDMNILSILYDNEATAIFKSMKKNDVYIRAELTEANFRKAMYRLTAIGFVENVTGNREHSLFITTYGIYAMNKTYEGEVVNK